MFYTFYVCIYHGYGDLGGGGVRILVLVEVNTRVFEEVGEEGMLEKRERKGCKRRGDGGGGGCCYDGDDNCNYHLTIT